MILNLVYYQCPMLCGEVLSGLESALRVLKFDVGKEFDILTVSFDPKETPEMAARKAPMLKALWTTGCGTGLALSVGPGSGSLMMRSPGETPTSVPMTIPKVVAL